MHYSHAASLWVFAADVSYALFVRAVLFILIAYFEYDSLRQNLDAFLRSLAIVAPSLSGLIPILAA